jgi:hypothetical protein
MDEKKLRKVIQGLIDIPSHKLGYVVAYKDLGDGLKLTITRYGFDYTQDVHDVLVDMVGAKLEGNEEIEYEWSEHQYENFVKYEPLERSTV